MSQICNETFISEWNSTVSKIGQNRLNICMQPQLWYMISWIIDNPQDSLIHSHSRWEVAQGLCCMSNAACCAWAYARSNRHLFCSLKYKIVKTCSWNLFIPLSHTSWLPGAQTQRSQGETAHQCRSSLGYESYSAETADYTQSEKKKIESSILCRTVPEMSSFWWMCISNANNFRHPSYQSMHIMCGTLFQLILLK